MLMRTLRGRIVAASLLCVVAAEPVAAMQLGGLFGGRSSRSSEEDKGGCEDREPSIGRTILGRVLGRVTRETTGAMGTVGTFIPDADVADELTNSIACRLDPAEQHKAADATLEATGADEVGATASWTSETREGVSGTSTVASRTQQADGATCMTVTDVIIVNGEETTEDKQMCRGPGESRYALVA